MDPGFWREVERMRRRSAAEDHDDRRMWHFVHAKTEAAQSGGLRHCAAAICSPPEGGMFRVTARVDRAGDLPSPDCNVVADDRFRLARPC